MNQEIIALLVVFSTLTWVFVRLAQTYLAHLLSHWLLQKGRVKWAMRIRKWTLARPGCNNCR